MKVALDKGSDKCRKCKLTNETWSGYLCTVLINPPTRMGHFYTASCIWAIFILRCRRLHYWRKHNKVVSASQSVKIIIVHKGLILMFFSLANRVIVTRYHRHWDLCDFASDAGAVYPRGCTLCHN